MRGDQRPVLEALMARMATGDRTAIAEFHDEFTEDLRRMVGYHASRTGQRVPRGELDSLAYDAAVVCFDCAAAWRPDGPALPWYWATRRIGSMVARWVGQGADELPIHLADTPTVAAAPAGEPAVLALLDALADENPTVARLRSALYSGVGDRRRHAARDVAVFLEVAVQTLLGDREPCATVADAYDLNPDVVRQIMTRTRRRVRAYDADLADLPLVA